MTTKNQPTETKGLNGASIALARGGIHSPQTTLNGEVHNWYRLRFGYPDHLVAELLDEFKIQAGESLLDPFCGSGTSLVECMKKGIHSVGVDANPSSFFAATVKTSWFLRPETIMGLVDEVESSLPRYSSRLSSLRADPTYLYLKAAGMIDRGWINPGPLRQAIALKQCISGLQTSKPHKRALLLALIAEVVDGASNIKFGPELYCGPRRKQCNVLAGFIDRVATMALDLSIVRNIKPHGAAEVIVGDSRTYDFVPSNYKGRFSAVICSPPYPAEHDYTRNARLELAFLEAVTDRDTLREIKKTMIRSHTKGIYKGDRDAAFVAGNKTIQRLTKQLETISSKKKYGFARLYPRVFQEYFGGMKRHLVNVKKFLRADSRCAYVVGDQASYLGVHIPTAKILVELAEQAGFNVLGIRKWRTRWASVTARPMD